MYSRRIWPRYRRQDPSRNTAQDDKLRVRLLRVSRRLQGRAELQAARRCDASRLCRITGADDAADSSTNDRRDVLVSLVAEVGRSYIELRGAQRQLVITNDNVKSQKDTLELTEQRFKAGLTSELDVARQRAQVDSTESQIPQLQTGHLFFRSIVYIFNHRVG